MLGPGPSGVGDQPTSQSSYQLWWLDHVTYISTNMPPPEDTSLPVSEGADIQGGAHLSSHRMVPIIGNAHYTAD